jgi:DNA-binding protein H-NS
MHRAKVPHPHAFAGAWVDSKSKRIAIAHIHTLMEYWQITVEDLQAHDGVESPQSALPIKYRHPITCESWDGQGAQPDWLRNALLLEGYRVEELRIEPG